MAYAIYGLRAAGSEIRYIGVTTLSLRARLSQHLKDARARGTHKRFWLRKALVAGATIEIERLDSARTSADAAWLERFWILVYRAVGARLTNACAGGRGLLAPTPATREKMVASHIGRRLSAETREKQRLAYAGKPYPKNRKSREITDAFRQRMREVALARPKPDEAERRRLGALRVGTVLSETHKQTIARRNRERWAAYTDEQRASRQSAVAAGGGFGSATCARKGAEARWQEEGIATPLISQVEILACSLGN